MGFRVFCAASALLFATTVFAGPRFLILSGGGSPKDNHYSQYLQAKTIAGGLRSRFGRRAVDVLFGAGNMPGSNSGVPDVHASNAGAPASAPPKHVLLTLSDRSEARLKGFEGDPCPECGQFTLVRNGSCLKCNSCGATTGCS